MSGIMPSLHNALMERFVNRPLDRDLIAQMTQFIHQFFTNQEVRFEVNKDSYDSIVISPLNIYTGLLFSGQNPDPWEVALKTIELDGIFYYENEYGRYTLNGKEFNIYPNDYIKAEVKVEAK